ncbi:hypothetical protein GC176_17875 [bacterium]|nr:hypothetical protein [bacterium]
MVRLVVAGAICAALLHAREGYAQGYGEISARDQIVDVIDWIPPEAETLTVVRKEYWIPPHASGRSCENEFAQNAVERFLSRVLGGERAAAGRAVRGRRVSIRHLLARRTVRLFVEASFNFRLFAEVGGESVSSESVYIIRFDDAVQTADKALFNGLVRNGGTVRKDWGHDIIEYPPTSRSTLYPDDVFWLAVPRSDVLLISTRKALLARALDGAHKSTDVAFPKELAEWKHIAATADVWGLRHYQEQIGGGDISDVRAICVDSGMAADGVLGQAGGFAFEVDSRSRIAHVTWVACDSVVERFLSSSFQHRVADSSATQNVPTDGIATFKISWGNGPGDARRRALFSSWVAWFLGHAGVI